MLMVMALLTTVDEVTQDVDEVSVHVTTSPFCRSFLMSVLDVAPAMGLPFTRHKYVGVVPPLVMVAVNVTLFPSHAVEPAELAIDMVGVTGVFTTIDAKPLETGFPHCPVTRTKYKPASVAAGLVMVRVGVVVPE
jgi:hypothetical protein